MACASRPPVPKAAVQHNDLGAEALLSGDVELARSRIELALEYSPRFTEAWVNRATLELSVGNFELAIAYAKRARSLNPDLPAPHHALGLIRDKRGDLERAAHHYEDALRVDPGFVPARENLARILFQQGRFQEARAHFQKMLSSKPDADEARAYLVECLWKLGRETDADRELDALSLASGNVTVDLVMAHARLRRGDALSSLERLREIAEGSDLPRAARAWSLLSVSYAALGRVHEASAASKRAHPIEAGETRSPPPPRTPPSRER